MGWSWAEEGEGQARLAERASWRKPTDESRMRAPRAQTGLWEMTRTDRTPIASTRTSGYYALSREMEQRLPEFFEVLGEGGRTGRKWVITRVVRCLVVKWPRWSGSSGGVGGGVSSREV